MKKSTAVWRQNIKKSIAMHKPEGDARLAQQLNLLCQAQADGCQQAEAVGMILDVVRHDF